MKFTSPNPAFKAALAAVAQPPGETPTLLSTLAVVLTADELGGLTLRRTTPNANILTEAAADIETEGEATVDYATLNAAVGGLSGDKLDFTLAANILEIKSGRAWRKLNAYQPDETPKPLEQPDALTDFDCSSNELKAWVEATICAAFKDAAKPNLQGVTLRTNQGQMSFLGTDGRRIHLCFAGARKDPVRATDGWDQGVMMMPASAEAILRLLPPEDAKAKITIGKGGLVFACGGATAILPVAESAPPNLKDFVPWKTPAVHSAEVSREELLRAIRGVMPLGFGDTRTLTVSFGSDFVSVEGDTEKGGSGGEEIEAKTTVKKGAETYRANGQFLADLLNTQKTETVLLEYLADPPKLLVRSEAGIAFVMLIRDGK
jgi:DNA polymerase III subunit beta